MMHRMQRTECQGCMMLQWNGKDRKLWLQTQNLGSFGIREHSKDVLNWDNPFEDTKKLTLLTCRKQLALH